MNARADYCHLTRAAQTLASQAERLGYAITAAERANYTRSCYLTISHPRLCDCDDACEGGCNPRLIRISDHEPNEARYEFAINERPDFSCKEGYQAEAIAWLAELIGREPPAYVKIYRTRKANLQAARDRARRAQAEADAGARRAWDERLAALSPTNLALLREEVAGMVEARKEGRRVRHQSGRKRRIMRLLGVDDWPGIEQLIHLLGCPTGGP